MLEKFYTTRAASELLNVSIYTIQRHVRDGTLKAEKINNKWYISETNLKEYINKYNLVKTCSFSVLPPDVNDIKNLKLLRPAEVADRLRVTENAVRIWIKKGRLRAIKPSGKILIPLDWFIEFIDKEYMNNGFFYAEVDENGTPEKDDDPPQFIKR